MRKICLGMVGLTLCTLSVMAQSRKVTGRVVSKEDGEPIIGASIIANHNLVDRDCLCKDGTQLLLYV